MSKGTVLRTARAVELSKELHIVKSQHVNRRAEHAEDEVDQMKQEGEEDTHPDCAKGTDHSVRDDGQHVRHRADGHDTRI